MITNIEYSNWKWKKLEKKLNDDHIVEVSKHFESSLFDIAHLELTNSINDIVDEINEIIDNANEIENEVSLFECMAAIDEESSRFFRKHSLNTSVSTDLKLLKDYLKILKRLRDIILDAVTSKDDKRKPTAKIHAYNGNALFTFNVPPLHPIKSNNKI